jgi:hypothetical protein
MTRRSPAPVVRFVALAGLACALTLAGTADGPATATLHAQSPALRDLLDKATEQTMVFIDRLSNVVTEELYVQEMTRPRAKRTMRSELALVRYPGATQWLMFRDVHEVDGKPVADRDERLQRLFLEPPRSALRRAAEIAQASARHNLVDIGTLNNPLLAMAFLQPQYRDRFRFNLAGLAKDLGPQVRTVRFEEFRRPTILRANSNNDLVSRGLMWIDEATGRVVKTELEVGQSRVAPEIVTLYRFDEELGVNVPAEMRDWYPDGGGEIRGVATYGKFRKFEVRTDESIEP